MSIFSLRYRAHLIQRDIKNNTNVLVRNFGVSNIEENLIIEQGGVLSTARKEVKQNFIRMGWDNHFTTPKTFEVSALPLDKLLEDNKIPQYFDLLVIDVEGFEYKVLQGFNINYWRPKMIIIELHDQNRNYVPFIKENFYMAQLFYTSNYRIIFKDLSNTIFVANELFDLSDL